MSRPNWATFVADCRSFVEGEWADRAAALGWDGRQLFGCHLDKPYLVTWWGAMWFVAGGEITSLTDTTALIKSVRGVRHTVRRMDHRYDFIVPVWEVK